MSHTFYMNFNGNIVIIWKPIVLEMTSMSLYKITSKSFVAPLP